MTIATPVKLVPINYSANVKSISDDDLCATCAKCSYQPGAMSGCEAGWPGLEDADGYVQQCASMVSTKDTCKAFSNPAT